MFTDYNNVLKKYENSACLGLSNGRCGLALSAFILSDKDEKYKQQAFVHLDYLLEHVYESSSLSFNEGLIGIGWTIEFLTQNQYILNSNDSLLLEIDDVIYKWVNFHQLDSYSINNGYIGALLYFCYRLKGDRILLPYRELALKECTVRILGKLYKEAKKQTNAYFSEIEWKQLHVLVGLFKKMGIQNHISDDLLVETRKMVKRISIQYDMRSNNLMEMLYFLFVNSMNNRLIKIFFIN